MHVDHALLLLGEAAADVLAVDPAVLNQEVTQVLVVRPDVRGEPGDLCHVSRIHDLVDVRGLRLQHGDLSLCGGELLFGCECQAEDLRTRHLPSSSLDIEEVAPHLLCDGRIPQQLPNVQHCAPREKRQRTSHGADRICEVLEGPRKLAPQRSQPLPFKDLESVGLDLSPVVLDETLDGLRADLVVAGHHLCCDVHAVGHHRQRLDLVEHIGAVGVLRAQRLRLRECDLVRHSAVPSSAAHC